MSHRLGEDEALERLKGFLSESYPSLQRNDVWSQYQEICEGEADEIRAQMAPEEAEKESDAEAAEDGNAENFQDAEVSRADPTENVPPSA